MEVVRSYGATDWMGGKYDITMYRDEHRTEASSQARRTAVDENGHFKWNIENYFKRVPVSSVDEALALYESRKTA